MHIILQQLPIDDIARIAEIDRTEHVTVGYTASDGALTAAPVDWHVPAWHTTGDGPHSVAGMIKAWKPILEKGGVLIGAFDGERLAGIAIVRYRLAEAMAQLAILFVSREYRRHGIARQLVHEVERLARADGATRLYVSATPSESAVGFYLNHGFVPTAHPDPDLFAKEPEDIHMLKELECEP